MKKRLGQFLLKGFQRTPRRKASPKIKKKLKLKAAVAAPRSRLRISEMQLGGERRVRVPEPPTEIVEVVETLIELESPVTGAAAQVSEVQPQTQLELVPEVLPAQDVQPVQPMLPFGPAGLHIGPPMSTADMVRPNDQLKQSIEAFLMDQRSPHTRTAYGKDLKRFVRFLHSRNYNQDGKVEDLNRTILIAYKESLVTEGLEHTTIDRHLSTLKSFFRWLVDDGVLFKSPADGVRFLNPKRISRTNGFTDEEVKRVLTLPDLHTRTGSLHYAVLMVLFYCGLRRSEVCGLETVNLGMERNQRVIRLRGKGNSERLIVLIPPVWNALKHYFLITRRNITDNNFIFLPLKNNRTGQLKKSLDPSMIFYIVTRYAKLAGIANKVSPHSCRATAISNARDHQVPDRAIQEFAGWASPDMITRYDKRKTSVEDSAAHGILYGAEDRSLPYVSEFASSREGLEIPAKK